MCESAAVSNKAFDIPVIVMINMITPLCLMNSRPSSSSPPFSLLSLYPLSAPPPLVGLVQWSHDIIDINVDISAPASQLKRRHKTGLSHGLSLNTMRLNRVEEGCVWNYTLLFYHVAM